MARFCQIAIRLAQQCPEYEDHAKQAVEAVRRAQMRMVNNQPTRWRASRPVRRLVRDIWERFGVVPY